MSHHYEWGRVWRLWARFKIHPGLIIVNYGLVFLTVFFEAVSFTLLPKFLKGLFDRNFAFIGSHPVFRPVLNHYPELAGDWQKMFFLIAAVIYVAALAKNACQYLAKAVCKRWIVLLLCQLREAVFARYLSFGKLFFDTTSYGYLSSVATGFLGRLADNLEQIQNFFLRVMLVLFYFGFMFMLSWPLTLILGASYLLQAFAGQWIVKEVRKISVQFTKHQKAMSKYLFDTLTCMPLIKSYGQEKEAARGYSAMTSQESRYLLAIDRRHSLIDPLGEFILLTTFLIFAVVMAMHLRSHTVGEMSKYLVFIYLARTLARNLTYIIRQRSLFAQVHGVLNEVMGVFSDEGKAFVPDGLVEFAGLRHGIEIKNLNFRYVPNTQVLHDVSFNVEKGKMTAVVGPSGSGKSTLIHLLMRFYDCPPRTIFVDGADIRDLKFRTFCRTIAFVSQDTHLFHDTIRSNILYGMNGCVSERELCEATEKARLLDFVSRLPAGFDTLIGDRGIRLSGGEKQRIALARAFLKKPDILFLDEATSSLDSMTEQMIQEAILEMIHGRTSIVIAHRLSTIKNAHKIIVLEGGKIVQQGTLDELLTSEGSFYQYWHAQMFH